MNEQLASIDRRSLPMKYPSAAGRLGGIVAACACMLGSQAAAASGESAGNPEMVEVGLVCSEGLVNKDNLADQLLIKYPVSKSTLQRALSGPERSRRQALSSLVKQATPCAQQCEPGDEASLRNIKETLQKLAAGSYKTAFAVKQEEPEKGQPPNKSQPVDPLTLLDDNALPITCKRPDPDPLLTRYRPGRGLKQRVRIRGKENDLTIPLGDPALALALADKAALTIENDDVQRKRTHDSHGYIGFSLYEPPAEFERNSIFRDLVVYAGGRRESIRNDGVDDRLNEKRTLNGGVVLRWFRPGIGWDHGFVFRTDFLTDKVDHSQIGSFRAEYTPYNPAIGVNLLRPIGGLRHIYGKIIFSVPVDYGKYTRRRLGAGPAEQPNFGHAGARLGAGLQFDNDLFPIDVKASYTSLRAWHGDIDVNYLKGGVDVNLSRKGYLALGLSYSRGRLEDTFKPEKKWGVALKGMY